MIFIRVQAVTGKLKELEEYRAGLHTDSFWHFPPLLNGTRSSGLLFECLDLQSYFDLWVINHFKLLLLPPSHILLTFHLFRHILTNDKFCVDRYRYIKNLYGHDGHICSFVGFICHILTAFPQEYCLTLNQFMVQKRLGTAGFKTEFFAYIVKTFVKLAGQQVERVALHLLLPKCTSQFSSGH